MKKIAFMFAVAAMLVACGGNGNKPAEEVATDSIAEVDTAVVDSAVVDSAAVDTAVVAE